MLAYTKTVTCAGRIAEQISGIPAVGNACQEYVAQGPQMLNIDEEQKLAVSVVHKIVEATGLSASAVARKAGLSPSTLTRIYPTPGVSYTLSSRTLAKLRKTFPEVGVDGSDASEKAPGIDYLHEQRSAFVSETPNNSVPVISLLPYAYDTEENIQILQDFEFYLGDFDSTPKQTRIPLSTSEPDRYFAAYIPGDAMEPRFRAGERIFVDQLKPASLHGDVMITFNDNAFNLSYGPHTLVMIAELVNRDRNMISVKQHRYNHVAPLHRSLVKNIYPIVGFFEYFS